MRADSVARFTLASCTPGTFFRARSTRITHEAQVMPPMPMSSEEGERMVFVAMPGSVILAIMARSRLGANQPYVIEGHGTPLDLPIMAGFRLCADSPICKDIPCTRPSP